MCKSNQTVINQFESSKKQHDELKCLDIFKKLSGQVGIPVLSRDNI